MSGHSKWSTIKRQKGANDAKRGATFTKIANAITIAARSGGSGDPDSNPRLRLALEKAREVNMPKDNIARAIDRGVGKGEGQTLEEVFYEGFGPGKVGFIVEGITDNKMRTTSEIKNIFDRSGGAIAGSGSVSYQFDKKGEIKVTSKGGSSDDELLELIDVGADDVEEYEDEGNKKYLVYVEPTQLMSVSTKITQSGFSVESSEQVYRANNSVSISDPAISQKVMEFAEKLEDHDDVQKVFFNADFGEN